jgi:hypothetical protein
VKGRDKKRITVRVSRRAEPDIRKLSRALIDLVQAQTEADAERAHHATATPPTTERQPARGSRP